MCHALCYMLKPHVPHTTTADGSNLQDVLLLDGFIAISQITHRCEGLKTLAEKF